MEQKRTQDPTKTESSRDTRNSKSYADPSQLASNAVEALDNMSPRRHNDSRNEVHSCGCGALVVIPKGHDVLEDDDKDVECHDCDKPLGAKMYDALR